MQPLFSAGRPPPEPLSRKGRPLPVGHRCFLPPPSQFSKNHNIPRIMPKIQDFFVPLQNR